MSLLTVGTVAFDTIETPYGIAERVVGGSCTYVSMAASYFIKNINLSAVIGDDFPTSELDYFRSLGINLEGLDIQQGEKSFFWHGRYHKNMNQRDTLVTDLNVLAHFKPVLPENYKTSDFVMLGNLTPDIQMSIINQMTKKPALIALDTMNFWMDIALDSLLHVLKNVDVLIINDEEARQLSGEHALRKAATKILTMGPKYLVIKKGEHGAMLFHKNEIFYVPALPLEKVFDRMVLRYDERPAVERRSDEEVWRKFRRDLENKKVLKHLHPKKISVADDAMEFQHAWKNGAWNCLEAVSFDLTAAESITEKAHRWLGHVTSIKEAPETFKLILLLGEPQAEKLRPAFAKAVSILSKIPVPKELVSESQSETFSEKFAHEMVLESRPHDLSLIR